MRARTARGPEGVSEPNEGGKACNGERWPAGNATQIQRRRSCSKCDHLIKVQMHKVFLNNLWIWLYLGIIKAKLAAEGQSRSQGRGFSAYPGTVAEAAKGREPGRAGPRRAPERPLELIRQNGD